LTTIVGLGLAMVLPAAPAGAWNVFTHEFTGQQVQNDLSDGSVTIAGHDYPVNTQVNDAIQSWPSYYNAGVVGPDGFPDTAYGEVTIHPGNKPRDPQTLPSSSTYGQPAPTGAWLGYLLGKAWAAQSDSSYSTDEKAQILAFTYGFLTHAAGDTWAHTLINDYAGGVYPAIPDIVTYLPAARMALRHLITEQYIGSTAPGFDSPDGDDGVDGSCDNANTSPPNTICNPGTADEQRVEVSRVCADDANPPTPGTECTTEDGSSDYSADSSPGIALDIPKEFIQRTMVSLNARTPADGCEGDGDGDYGCPDGTYNPTKPSELTRGPILDRVLDEEAKLQIYAAKVRDDQNHSDCSTALDSDCHDRETLIFTDTVRGRASVRVHRTVCTADYFCIASASDAAYDLTIAPLLATYAEHWAADIDTMRDHWADFGLAVSRGWFDPQTRRNAANDLCDKDEESVTNRLRNECEAGVGILDSIRWSLGHINGGDQSWIDDYLLPAAGVPDFVLDISDFVDTVGDYLGELFDFLEIPNPIAPILADAEAWVNDKINEWVEEELGVDVEAISQFSKTMAQWMCGNDGTLSLDLPNIGTVTPSMLFSTGEHDRLDGLLGISADHHETAAGLPEQCSPVKDATRLDPAHFAPLKNTITLGKLLLLDGPQLNNVLGTTLVDAGVIRSKSFVHTYGGTALSAPANVMVDHLQSNGTATHFSSSQAWLQLIDGDHAWRRDGLPRFQDNDLEFGPTFCYDDGYSVYDRTSTCHPATLPGMVRQAEPRDVVAGSQWDGGRGNFPVWESCLLRPAFRSLFTDWENGGNNFPDNGDTASPDAGAPNPPGANLDNTGTYSGSDGKLYAGTSNVFTLTYHDFVFTDAYTDARYRFYKDGNTPGAWHSIASGGTFSVSGTDGLYKVEYQTQDPCHTYDTNDLLSDPVRSIDVVLDTTPPVITIASPAPDGRIFDTASTSTISYTAVDAASGVKTTSVTLDGASSTNGATIDTFFLYPGTHSVVVTASDNLDNTGTATRTFKVQATSASLLSNWSRARTLGLVPDTKTYNGGRDKLLAAVDAHNRGQHSTEGNQLSAFISLLQAQRGQGVQAATADRFIAWTRDLINRKG
jgi:hypothetical protein